MILHDLRHAFRQLIRVPGFTLTAIVTLALGIGANSAIFSVVNAVLRHPAGVDHPERVAIQSTSYKQLGMDFPGVSVPDYADAAALHDQVEAAAIVSATNFNMLHDGRVEHLSGALRKLAMVSGLRRAADTGSHLHRRGRPAQRRPSRGDQLWIVAKRLRGQP